MMKKARRKAMSGISQRVGVAGGTGATRERLNREGKALLMCETVGAVPLLGQIWCW